MALLLDSVDENVAFTNSPTKISKFSTKQIKTDFGDVNVYIYGDLAEKDKRAVFITVHDIGTNHNIFFDFLEQPCMNEILARSIFINLDLPGQSNDCSDYEGNYPTIQKMGEKILPRVLDELDIPLVVGIGDGAGANILVRFALKYTERILGLVLIHLVSAGVGILEKLKETFKSGKRRPSETFQQPETVIALHRFGKNTSIEENSIVADCKARISNINPNNLRKYVEAYMNRKDISEKLSNANIDCLLIVGGKSSYLNGVMALYSKMNKSKTSLLKVDNVIDVMNEAPQKLAQSMLLFVKGLGYLTSLNLDRQRTLSTSSNGSGDSPANKAALGAIGRRRTLSMEEYDIPRPRRLSLTAQQNGNNLNSPQK